MRKILILALFLTALSNTSYAQKFGYIDSDFILKKMPEYKEAEKELNELSSKWQKEIEDLKSEHEKMVKGYQSEEVLLTEEMKKERLAEIAAKEKAVKDRQKKVFGFEGLVFLKRQELIKPVQDLVYEAVEKVAKKKKLSFVFDRSGALIMIYTNPVHDYTDYVLEELGLGDKDDYLENNK
ncbi:OmpH family outer membrane protein [Cytophagaceae bacterium ABcell3]|nr:OmpH family outer membrane protein [Cytophagaceae bacterium ABcell3]